MPAQRLRRWPDIKPALADCLVFTEIAFGRLTKNKGCEVDGHLNRTLEEVDDIEEPESGRGRRPTAQDHLSHDGEEKNRPTSKSETDNNSILSAELLMEIIISSVLSWQYFYNAELLKSFSVVTHQHVPTPHTTLLRRLINVNDVDTTSQQ